MTYQPTNHYTLTKKQRDILNLLYRFRFATSEQISKTLNIHKSVINKRLKLMMELKYIGRRYEPEYHLLRKHASYYLLPEGVKTLKGLKSKRYSPRVLRNIRSKEGDRSEQFVDHCLAVFDIYQLLRSGYGDSLQFFTTSQMATSTYFPKQLPDAHVQLREGESKLFLLDLLHQGDPFFRATRRVFQYFDYAENGEWPTRHAFPKILLVCDSISLQKRLIKRMKRKLDNSETPKLKFFITNLPELKDDVWYNMADPKERLTLSSIT